MQNNEYKTIVMDSILPFKRALAMALITGLFAYNKDGRIEYIDEKTANSSAMDSWCNNAIVNK